MDNFEHGTLADTLGRRLWPLDAQGLCVEAQRKTGLTDFGDPPLEPALSILAESLDREADLHSLGRFLMRTHLRDLLMTRLRLVHDRRWREGTPNGTPIQRPVFITGMPRSGSTFLHELLAQDPDNRVPRVWETMYPVPPRNGDLGRRDPRLRKAAVNLWWFRRLAPRADLVHPLRAEMPQECVAIHSYTLISEEFLDTCHLPRYESFLRGADLRPAYAWQKRFLEHLPSPVPAKRWLLKSPDHVRGLEALFSVFPDAVVVLTHRNPVEVFKSSIQLVEVLHALFARRRGAEQRALREARILAEAMEHLICFREAHPELANRFVDVKYSDLVRDPLGTVRQIYAHLDIKLTSSTADLMRQFAANRSRYPKPRRSLPPANLNTAAEAQASRFRRYCFRFDLPWHEAGGA